MTATDVTRNEAAARRPSAAQPTLGDVVAGFTGMLRRRLWQMIAVAVAVMLVALAIIMSLTPRYEAETRLRIDPSRNPMTQGQSPGGLNPEAIESEIGIMTSQELAREVVLRANLLDDPTIMPRDLPAEMSRNERLNYAAQQLMRGVSVRRDKLSYIIVMAYQAGDPQRAAAIANAYAATYIDTRVSSQVGTSERQAEFFRRRLGELAKAVNTADAALAGYRARAGISENATTGTVADQQIAPLSAQLATAEAAAASARSEAAAARSQVARGSLDAVSAVRSSPVVTDLRRQRAEVVRNLGEVEARYEEKHPESIRVKEQLAALDSQIRQEAGRVVSSIQSDADAASAQVASLRATMRSLEGQRAQNTLASAEADRLEREATSAREAYDKMSQLSLESTQSARSGIAQAEIIDRAQPPASPSWPKRRLLALLALAVAGAAALGTAILLELLQGGLRSTEDVQDRLGLPLLASIPAEGGRGRLLFDRIGVGAMRLGRLRRTARPSPADRIGAAGATMYGEAVRNLRASLLGRDRTGSATVIAVTSALPEEGKTTTTLALARTCAVSGARVLLIDGDLRNAGLGPLIGAAGKAGVVEVLSGAVSLDAALAADRTPGLSVLPVAARLFTSQDLFGDGAMERLLAAARERFDVILLDLPPVLGVADARTLALLADTVAFVVRWGATAPRAVEMALAQLEGDGAALAGIVYTMVDTRSDTIGGVYYSRKYHKYYRDQ